MKRIVTKACTRCGQTKPLADFYDHPGRADGKQSRCKVCTCLASAERARRVRQETGRTPACLGRAARRAKWAAIARQNAEEATVEAIRALAASYFDGVEAG